MGIFYKGKHLPFRIKLDISKGEILKQARNIEAFVTEVTEEQVKQLARNNQNSFDSPLIVVDVHNQ